MGCLAALSGHEHINATLLESTRVLGGRVRSKAALGALAWDQGASYFTAKDPASPFAEVLRAGRADGVVELWAGGDASPGARNPRLWELHGRPSVVGSSGQNPRRTGRD